MERPSWDRRSGIEMEANENEIMINRLSGARRDAGLIIQFRWFSFASTD
jgi:hypothetical protein